MAPRRPTHLVLTLVLVNACAAARPERAAPADAAPPSGRQLTLRDPDAAWIFGALSPDGATAVSMSDDGTLELIDVATGRVRPLPPPPAGTMTGDGGWHDDGVLRVLTRDGDRLRTWKVEPLAGTFTEEQRPDVDADGTTLWGDRKINRPARDRDPTLGQTDPMPRDPPHARAITPASEDPRVPPIAP